jgi:hypothetical protein
LSDQDFFFDDEEAEAAEETEAKKPAAKRGTASKTASTSASKPAPKAAAKAAPASSGSFFDQQVSVAIASLIGVIALLVGIIGGYMLAGPSTPVAPSAGTTQTTPGAVAPQLSPDQLNSGQLPAGHPAVGGAGATPSKPATPGK